MPADGREHLETLKRDYPEKFADTKKIFGRIHRGSSIFVGTACGEPQHLVNELIGYVSSTTTRFRRGGDAGLDARRCPL